MDGTLVMLTDPQASGHEGAGAKTDKVPSETQVTKELNKGVAGEGPLPTPTIKPFLTEVSAGYHALKTDGTLVMSTDPRVSGDKGAWAKIDKVLTETLVSLSPGRGGSTVSMGVAKAKQDPWQPQSKQDPRRPQVTAVAADPREATAAAADPREATAAAADPREVEAGTAARLPLVVEAGTAARLPLVAKAGTAARLPLVAEAGTAARLPLVAEAGTAARLPLVAEAGTAARLPLLAEAGTATLVLPAALDPLDPLAMRDPLAPLATLDPLAPLATLDPLAPLATLDPLAPLATLDPLAPLATLDPLAPLATLDPHSSSSPSGGGGGNSSSSPSGQEEYCLFWEKEWERTAEGSSHNTCRKNSSPGVTAVLSRGIPARTVPGNPSDSYPNYATSAEVSTMWPTALSIRRGRSRGFLGLYNQQGVVDCCSQRPSSNSNSGQRNQRTCSPCAPGAERWITVGGTAQRCHRAGAGDVRKGDTTGQDVPMLVYQHPGGGSLCIQRPDGGTASVQRPTGSCPHLHQQGENACCPHLHQQRENACCRDAPI
ncbi:UNVERIFIED_CONTAM: hypothetical protein FKN15_044451 [Acipenser sinensis]